MPRWTEISDDPNSTAACDARFAVVCDARRPVIPDKIAYLKELARGKRVLDVGVVAHRVEAEQNSEWLHHHVAGAASYCLGVDILPEAVQKLKEKGYNIIVCDITKDMLDERFDMIIAGDVIEHLPSPQGLFDAAARLLVDGGRLVILTPNPYYVHRAYRMMRGRFRESVDHIAHFDASNIAEMAERAGMRLDSFRGIAVHQANIRSFVGKTLGRMRHVVRIFGFSPESLCNTVLYECVKG